MTNSSGRAITVGKIVNLNLDNLLLSCHLLNDLCLFQPVRNFGNGRGVRDPQESADLRGDSQRLLGESKVATLGELGRCDQNLLTVYRTNKAVTM